jgi:protein-disulfide isomerase
MNIDELLSEKVMGLDAAPITVVAYSSLTCPHCATFHLETLPQLKRSYIDTGQVKYVQRDFPVAGASTAAVAAAGAALARCAGNARYFEGLDLLFAAQESWVRSGDPVAAMKQALAPIGMPQAQMDACLASQALREGIERQRVEGQSAHGVAAVPAVLVNDRRVADDSFAGLAAVLVPLTPPSSTCRNACHRVE